MEDLDSLLNDYSNNNRSRSSSRTSKTASKRIQSTQLLDLDKELEDLGLTPVAPAKLVEANPEHNPKKSVRKIRETVLRCLLPFSKIFSKPFVYSSIKINSSNFWDYPIIVLFIFFSHSVLLNKLKFFSLDYEQRKRRRRSKWRWTPKLCC